MLRDFVCVAVLMFLSAVSVFGQGAVAEFNGSAADQSGALLPGVAVTLTEETTGLMRTTASNESGRFVIPAITPGRHQSHQLRQSDREPPERGFPEVDSCGRSEVDAARTPLYVLAADDADAYLHDLGV